ncbi:hypothetical protein CLV60_113153 [Dyadobacter jiangsuensis]|uniref:Uncharacterized protein n=1 Tax=Dyadobacter jiangsuensis TaxID=1591085 RepID=A0A2P8FSP8_9BACT|nr:hypothetical protein CLV60_113153 [Dyadobacter jiangsuensis]
MNGLRKSAISKTTNFETQLREPKQQNRFCNLLDTIKLPILFLGLQIHFVTIKLNTRFIWRDQVFLYLCRPFEL